MIELPANLQMIFSQLIANWFLVSFVSLAPIYFGLSERLIFCVSLYVWIRVKLMLCAGEVVDLWESTWILRCFSGISIASNGVLPKRFSTVKVAISSCKSHYISYARVCELIWFDTLMFSTDFPGLTCIRIWILGSAA